MWQPIATAPDRKILVAMYAPTTWQYYVTTVHLYPDMPPRLKAMRLTYARAWMELPEEPEEEING